MCVTLGRIKLLGEKKNDRDDREHANSWLSPGWSNINHRQKIEKVMYIEILKIHDMYTFVIVFITYLMTDSFIFEILPRYISEY